MSGVGKHIQNPCGFKRVALCLQYFCVSCECGWGKKGELKKNLATALATMKDLEARA